MTHRRRTISIVAQEVAAYSAKDTEVELHVSGILYPAERCLDFECRSFEVCVCDRLLALECLLGVGI